MQRGGVAVIAYLRRYEVSAVEAIFSAVVLNGILYTVLRPDHVAHVISLSGWGAIHPAITTMCLTTLMVVLTGRLLILWGPVRVSGARLRWQLMGPDDRTPVLKRALRRVVAAAIIATLVCGAVIATLFPKSVVLVCSSAGAGAAAAVAVAYLRQTMAGPVRTRRWSLRLDSLHHKAFCPNDGLAQSAAMAITMMDMTWVADARVVRWQRAHSQACLRGGTHQRMLWWSLMVADWHRQFRRRQLWWVGAWCGLLVILPVILTVHVGGYVVLALLIYGAGHGASLGLRELHGDHGLRMRLGYSDATLYASQSIIPALVVIAAVALAIPMWNIDLLQAEIGVCGCLIAVIRRGLRPPLPYDAELVFDPFTGAPMQPRLLLVMVRGVAAAVATGCAMAVL